MNLSIEQKMLLKPLGLGLLASLAACSTISPPHDTSTLNKINTELKSASTPREQAREPILPPAVSSSLLPPVGAKMSVPKASKKQLEQRFDLVVKDSPISQVLMGIVSDTRYSIMVRPKNSIPTLATPAGANAAAAPVASAGLTDRVTINLKDVTMFEALDAISNVYGYDYTIEGNRIYVQQPELQTRHYQVNYVIGQRRGVSDLQVIGGASYVGSSSGSGGQGSGSGSGSSGSGSGSSGSGGGSSPGSFSSVQASALSTIAKSDFWGEVEDALRTSLGCQIPNRGAAPLASSSSGSGMSSRADVSFAGDTPEGERQRGVGGCPEGRAMTINPMSGTIVVRGMPNEHRMVAQMLRSMQVNIERQVIIEAKIIDVELNSNAQQGINWAGFEGNRHRFSVGADTERITANTYVDPETGTTELLRGSVATSLGNLLGTGMLGTTAGTAFTNGLGVAIQNRNFLSMINFLQTQGRVHVLSSPRIATLNSQKAVIKVGTEEAFVVGASGGQTTAATTVSAAITNPVVLTYQPFFSGISLDVTPRIDDKDNITLHVHAMVNSVVEKGKLATTTSEQRVPFAVNTISETDSVVKTKDSQVVVIGGLMTESTQDDRAKVPLAGDAPLFGPLFSKGGQKSVKRELVILLKPTVVKDDSAWTNDIAAAQGRIESGLSSSQSANGAQ